MSKSPRRLLAGEGIFGKSGSHADAQAPDHADVQLRDEEIPGGKGGRAQRGTREGDVHRSLYAKPETFEMIRRLAFDKNTTAQTLYREGVLLMLQRHGLAGDKGPEDI